MSAPDLSARSGGPPRYIGLAAAGAAALALMGGVAFYFASQGTRPPAVADAFPVTITSHSCKPNSLSVPAGLRKFEILNQSDRTVEWEILDGVMVLAERENILPGFKQSLTTELAPGDYQMTCGLLNNLRGALHVAPSENFAVASSSTPTLRAFLGPLAEYQFYVGRQSNKLVDGAQTLADAIKGGDLAAARAAYLAARGPYKRLETVAYRFSDLVNKLDPLPDYLAKREDDPEFTGFHRLAYGLFVRNNVEGLAPVADQLVADAADLKARLRDAKLTPADLASGASRLAQQLGSGRTVSGEDAYSRTDLDDIAANLESIGKIVALMTPVVKKSAPEAAAGADEAVAETGSALGRLKKDNAYPSFDSIDAATRASLAKAFSALADAIDKLESAVDVRS